MFFSPSTQSAVLALFCIFGTSFAHTVMTTIFVDGVNQGDGVCIRMNMNGSTSNNFIKPITSKDMACGIDGEIGGSRVCPANASSIITFEYREDPSNVDSPSIDPSHKGPAAVYLKKVDSAIASNNAAGDGWFKIWESVYDNSTQTWATTKMIKNNGHISVKIPDDIQGGSYLIRSELLALHAADTHPPDPQFYVGCAQLYIMANGNAQPSTVTIGEGTYTLDTPGMAYNIYTTPLALPYPMYGPPVYQPGPGNGNGSYPPPQCEGLKPKGCIFVNGNWCGYEVPSYTDQKSCWNSSDMCWAQSKDCWNKTQPSGFQFCKVFQAKSASLSQACTDKEWTGPPNPGKDITPEWPPMQGSLDIFT
ncbi:Glycosyl hydrolase family 61 domain containing protein [Elaphomyces granulatus]